MLPLVNTMSGQICMLVLLKLLEKKVSIVSLCYSIWLEKLKNTMKNVIYN